MNYVIIGNSTAGIGCIEGIRQIDKNGKITIISDEPYHCYSRPLISYFLQGKINRENINYRSDSFYKDNDVSLLSGVSAVKIDPEQKTVELSSGKFILYDKLLIAAGSSAYVPPIEGINSLNNKHTFMTLDDAQKLKSQITCEKKVLIIGAGLIGLKCAEGILGHVPSIAITIADLAPHVLASILDDHGAALVQNCFEERGVNFKLKKTVNRFEPLIDGQKGYCALFSDGTKINFDIAVLAAGVKPNTDLAAGIAQIGKGIVINEKCETSCPDIYAAGDCTESLDISSGKQRIMALLPNAYMQGECAGVNMAGGKQSFSKALPMNAIGFFGLHIISAGNYEGEVYESNKDACYKKLFYSDNKLNGFIFIGNIEKAGIYTSLIRERVALDSIDFPLICEKPGLMAFTKEIRAEKLGGS